MKQQCREIRSRRGREKEKIESNVLKATGRERQRDGERDVLICG